MKASASEDLQKMFDELNHRFFQGKLAPIPLVWNARLRSSAGRFRPGKIEVATYLLLEVNGEVHVRDTLAHEMVHYWLWSERLPYGHTPLFRAKLREVGASRYNPVPKRNPFKHKYVCTLCSGVVLVRRQLSREAACARCCKQYAQGKFDRRFLLKREQWREEQ